MRIELMIPHSKMNSLVYGMIPERQGISDYFIDDENMLNVDTTNLYVSVTYYNDGRRGSDIQYLTEEEVIVGVLREYERLSSIIRNEQNELLVVDHGHLK